MTRFILAYAGDTEDGNLRENFIGLFHQVKHALLIVARLNRDGSLIWNVMQRDEKGMNRLREGVLVWSKKELMRGCGNIGRTRCIG